MTNGQKIIKYLAIAFAFFIIISIIRGIVFGISSVGVFFNNDKSYSTNEDIIYEFDSNILRLDIDLQYSNLEIRENDYLYVTTNNKNISCNYEGNSLMIKENNAKWFSNNNSNITIYIPNELILDNVDIDTGAGKIDIKLLNTNDLKFSLGAGKVIINKLNVTSNAKIDCGTGKFDILDGIINKMDMDIGVGSVDISLKSIGNSKISTGIGSMNLNLKDDISNYKFKVSKGIGSVKINNDNASDNEIIGNGNNYIEIDGGIGDINISTN